MKIVFFEIHDWEKRLLKARLKEHVVEFHKEPLTMDTVGKAADAEIISIFIYSKIDQAILDKMPDLKLITTRSTGYDHIDVKTSGAKNIPVCTVPFYGENTVAEHTFALILSLSRNIHKSYVRTLRNDFTIEGLKGFDLKGKTIGVIGGGHIGLHVARMAKGFGMDVLVFDMNRNEFMAEVMGYNYATMEELLKKSDIITLHVPYNKFTHHLINKDNIKLIKKGAILINTARGGLVDTEALIEALDKGILGGAGLDVLEGEELIKEEKQLLHDQDKLESLKQLAQNHVVLSKDNIVYTPHIAFYSQEALERILETTVDNITAFISGKPLNVVVTEAKK